jgi:hypothetical protein
VQKGIQLRDEVVRRLVQEMKHIPTDAESESEDEDAELFKESKSKESDTKPHVHPEPVCCAGEGSASSSKDLVQLEAEVSGLGKWLEEVNEIPSSPESEHEILESMHKESAPVMRAIDFAESVQKLDASAFMVEGEVPEAAEPPRMANSDPDQDEVPPTQQPSRVNVEEETLEGQADAPPKKRVRRTKAQIDADAQAHENRLDVARKAVEVFSKGMPKDDGTHVPFKPKGAVEAMSVVVAGILGKKRGTMMGDGSAVKPRAKSKSSRRKGGKAKATGKEKVKEKVKARGKAKATQGAQLSGQVEAAKENNEEAKSTSDDQSSSTGPKAAVSAK